MRNALIALLILGSAPGCAHRQRDSTLGEVHPAVFAMVLSWLSDPASPIVTEINLDAVAANRNQFDRSEVRRDGEWVRVEVEDGRGFRRHRFLHSDPPRYKVTFQENLGGTLTTSDVIEFEVRHRTVDIDGTPTRIRVLRVLSIERMGGD